MNTTNNKSRLKDFDIEKYRESVSEEYVEVLREKKRAEGLHWLKDERKNLESELDESALQVEHRKQSLIRMLWEIFWGNFYCKSIDMNIPKILDEGHIDNSLWAEGINRFAVAYQNITADEQKELKKKAMPYWNSLFMNITGELATQSSQSFYRASEKRLQHLIDTLFSNLEIESEEARANLDIQIYTALSFHKRYSMKWERHMAAHMLAETIEYDPESFDKLLKENDDVSAYGFHQMNEKWIVDTWKSERKKVDSNNKADERVREFYNDEFGLSISKRHIQRLTGRG